MTYYCEEHGYFDTRWSVCPACFEVKEVFRLKKEIQLYADANNNLVTEARDAMKNGVVEGERRVKKLVWGVIGHLDPLNPRYGAVVMELREKLGLGEEGS